MVVMKGRRLISSLICLSILGLAAGGDFLLIAQEQQTASKVEPPRTVDRSFRPDITNPAYKPGKGSVVVVDEAHNNFHTSVGLYTPFALLVERDGYVIRRGTDKIAPGLLEDCRIYVIADAQPPVHTEEPPTFSHEEVTILNTWVREGGSLFLITDHMPDPGAVTGLAAAFGIEVKNGYAIKGPPPGPAGPLIFSRDDDTLRECIVTNGRNASEKVMSVATFAGSAFQAATGFIPVLVFGPGFRIWEPEEYWKFPPGTPNAAIEGWYQGGILEYGKGRVAFFCEAAMFTAQVFNNGRVKAGMNHPRAAGNVRLLLNILHWLDHII
ncbi:MAG: hypothetical protein JXB23_08020 [Candidatus Aminicenantes bacterium]|nr:hypothetical protein [Candidatus Aminicenantes bacterium]